MRRGIFFCRPLSKNIRCQDYDHNIGVEQALSFITQKVAAKSGLQKVVAWRDKVNVGSMWGKQAIAANTVFGLFMAKAGL